MATQVTEYRLEDFEHVTLETREAEVIPFPGNDLEWLARECMSTPFATVLRD